MYKSRALTGALIVGAVAVASMFAAAPASAATLPSGQKITIVDQYSDQAYDAAPADAALTAVGTPAGPVSDCVAGMDVDDTGAGYVIATEATYYCDALSEFSATLYSFDAVSGLIDESSATEIVLNFGDVTTPADECTSIDYTGGVILAICYDFTESFDAGYVGVLDPETGYLTPWAEGQFAGDGYLYFSAIAVDPTTGAAYGFSFLEEAFTMYTLSPDNGATNPLPLEYLAWGADFDREGQLFITTLVNNDSIVSAALTTVSLADGASPDALIYNVGGTPVNPIFAPNRFFTAAISVWGAPALAATGAAVSPIPVIGAAGLLLVGSILAAATMFTRRRSADA